jgi:hypothetical protein
MEKPNRREFIKIAGKTILVTSGISVFGLTNSTAAGNDETPSTGEYFTDGYYDDGYYYDGYYYDGYYYDGYYYDGYGTGINSYKPDLLQMAVLPNPSNGNFELQLSSKISGMAEIFITDLIGRTMMRETRELNLGSNKLNFNAEQLAKGVYYLSVITTKGTGSVRLIIAK